MSQTFGVLLMMNNYLHDVATALLAASGVALWAMLRHHERAGGGPEVGRYFLALHGAMSGLARLALAWIVVGGVPRAIWYREFEWANAAGRLQVPALVAKHVAATVLVVLGVSLWRRLRARAREIELAVGGPGR